MTSVHTYELTCCPCTRPHKLAFECVLSFLRTPSVVEWAPHSPSVVSMLSDTCANNTGMIHPQSLALPHPLYSSRVAPHHTTFTCGFFSFTHSAFALGYEAGINKSNIDGNLIPPGALVTFVQKGLQYVELEANLENVCVSESVNDGDDDFSFLQPLDLITKDVDELRRIIKEKKEKIEKERDVEKEKRERDRENHERVKDKVEKDKEQEREKDKEKQHKEQRDKDVAEDYEDKMKVPPSLSHISPKNSIISTSSDVQLCLDIGLATRTWHENCISRDPLLPMLALVACTSQWQINPQGLVASHELSFAPVACTTLARHVAILCHLLSLAYHISLRCRINLTPSRFFALAVRRDTSCLLIALCIAISVGTILCYYCQLDFVLHLPIALRPHGFVRPLCALLLGLCVAFWHICIFSESAKALKASGGKEDVSPQDKKGDTSKPEQSTPRRNFRD
ncbi:hypothetical protein AXF42_Ash004312 [Apostasia shenzhenica]|uniref:Uncharacterized protein n=1 Tax=Apostasia shenzhenica TaxID=1088818 RepID=A0A2I0A2J0_9ASPA|nr:hypothetical protein AXF42_Ash004312 [Apostasia shenzhenica]